MRWIHLLADATAGFAEVLESGDLGARVPACPGWTLADLGEHLRRTHAWAAHAVTDGDPDGEPAPGPLDRDALVAGYRAAAGHLLDVLAATAPDAPAWTFGAAQEAGFWRRRQVHETVMHRYDALASQGRAGEWAIAPALAWDGVVEVVEVFYPRQVRLGRTQPLAGSVGLVPTDVPDTPLVLGRGEPFVQLPGPAATLLLQLWERVPVDDPAVRAVLLSAAVTP